MRRTQFVVALAAAALTAATARADTSYAVTHSDTQWRKLLGDDRYFILRENGTEPAFSSPLIKESRVGTYHCAGCDQPVFSSKTKYDSGDGWPSFWNVMPNVTETRKDYELAFEMRTEIHCKRCGGHLGHIFDDGPPPTHLRYCIDGLALKFSPQQT